MHKRLFLFHINIRTNSFTCTQILQKTKRMTTDEETLSAYDDFLDRILDVEENPRTDFVP